MSTRHAEADLARDGVTGKDPGPLDVSVMRILNAIINDAVRLQAQSVMLRVQGAEAVVLFHLAAGTQQVATLPVPQWRAITQRLRLMSDIPLDALETARLGRLKLQVGGRLLPIEAQFTGTGTAEVVLLRMT